MAGRLSIGFPGRSREFLRQQWLRRTELQEVVQKLRLGENGPRPFGCSASLASLGMSARDATKGARITRTPKDQGCPKIPLQGVYSRIRKWLEYQFSRGEEPRPTQIRLRCELELATEVGTQRVLQKHKPEIFQDYVLKAASHRLQWLQKNRAAKAGKDWLNQTLLPRIGGRRRYGQKFNQTKNPPSQLKCQLQWETMDRMIHLVSRGTSEELEGLVQDPELFIQNREKTALIQTDATGVWVKLRGEEPRAVPETMLRKLQQKRAQTSRFRRRAAYMEPEERQLLDATLQLHAAECDDLKSQIDQQFSQGGDKYRLTLLVSGVTQDWFNPERDPRAYLAPLILLYPCQQPVRLEWISDQGTWNRTHQFYDSSGTLVTRTEGENTRGLLGWWVRFRQRSPDHEFWRHFQVWGQPSAWQDQVITTWLVESLSSHLQEQGVPQAVMLWDCMTAQWAEPVLHACWTHQMPLVPIMPDATAYLQSPDTHWNSPLKVDLRTSKGEVQHVGELAALRAKKPYQSNWGLDEVSEVLARTAARFKARNDQDKLMLRAAVENQLTIYRPSADGVLHDIADQQWVKDARILPEIPSKGIKQAWATARRDARCKWQDGVPNK